MVAVALVLLVQADPTAWLAITAAAIIIGREIAVSALREFMAEIGQRSQVKVAMVGKIKTVAQMSAIVLMVYRVPVGRVSHLRGWLRPADHRRRADALVHVHLSASAAWPSLRPGRPEEE